MARGKLIAIEGNDGAGKTTAMKTLAHHLQEAGYDVLCTREPGGSEIAEEIRKILLQPGRGMDPRTEALLYAAARREHLVSVIEPALAQGRIVLCDRFLDSSLAYQGAGRTLGMKEIEQLNDFGLQGFRPDATLFLSIDLETAEQRMNQRGEKNRLDAESRAFHQAVRDGFDQLLHDHPERYTIIDAAKSPEQVVQDMEAAIRPVLGETS